MKDFSTKIFAELMKVPAGRLTTYGRLAEQAGYPQAARAVGNTLNKNEHPVVVPCHRVVRSDGSVGGYAFGVEKKIELLRAEGIEIEDGKVLDLKRYL
jgi:methylated-DNA-[protein]-cysteine S-methyltransferase